MISLSIRRAVLCTFLLGAAACGAPETTDGGTDVAHADVHADARADVPVAMDTGGQDVPGVDVPIKVLDVPVPDVAVDDTADAAVMPDVVDDTTVATDVAVDVATGTDATDVATGTDALDVAVGTDAMDVATVTDVIVVADASDAARADAADAAMPDPCAAGAVVNVNTAGTRAGATTTYHGNNTTASGAGPLMGGCGEPGNEVALSYTARGTSLLRVSTDNAGTGNTFDTVAFALDRCAATGSTSLGCSDDDPAAGSPRTRSSVFTTAAPVAAGATVYIVVAGYTPPVTGTVNRGPFTLTVTEIAVVAVGGACDPMAVTSVCATGATCITAGTASTCVANGTRGGFCNTGSGLACNAGLGCTGDPTSARSRCVTGLAAHATCVPGSATAPCVAGDVCVTIGGASTCRGYGVTTIAAPTLIDACTGGTTLTLTDADDGHVTAVRTLPFTFAFFGTNYTRIWPDSNGYAALGTTAPTDDVNGVAIPDPSEPAASIAPFWDDLVVPATGHVCVITTGTAPNRAYVVEWHAISRLGHTPAVTLTFEIVLHESNTIDLIYTTLTPTTGADAPFANGSNASIGLQASDTLGVQYYGTVTAPHGITWTPM